SRQRISFEVRKGNLEGALEMARRESSLASQWGTDLIRNLIALLERDGRADEALVAARDYLGRVVREWGGDHWMVVEAHRMVGKAAWLTGDIETSLAEAALGEQMAARIGYRKIVDQEDLLFRVFAAAAVGRVEERDAVAAQLLAPIPGDEGWLAL